MSKRKPNKAAPQRYSGPELNELLDRVVEELGPSAEISAVNKIRAGGVAGFFCREEYEIVVDRSARSRPAVAAPKARTVRDQKAGEGAGPDGGHQDAVPAPDSQSDLRSDAESDYRSNAESVDLADEPITTNSAPAPSGPDGASEVFGGPRPREMSASGTDARLTASGTDARFMALLERRLDEASETEAYLASRRAGRPRPQPTAKLAVDEPRADVLTPARPAEAMPAEQAVLDRAGSAPVSEPKGFWAQVSSAGHELLSFLPAPSSFVVAIGPLSLCTPVVRRLRTEAELAAADVVVLTDRAEIVSEPTWQLVRSGHQLVDVAKERADWPTILVVDVPVELPQWVAPLQHRLRLTGVGVFHYAVPGNPSQAKLDDYRRGSDVPYVLDLVSRVAPERVVELVAEGHPIGSVGGTALTPELLVAMREQADGP